LRVIPPQETGFSREGVPPTAAVAAEPGSVAGGVVTVAGRKKRFLTGRPSALSGLFSRASRCLADAPRAEHKIASQMLSAVFPFETGRSPKEGTATEPETPPETTPP